MDGAVISQAGELWKRIKMQSILLLSLCARAFEEYWNGCNTTDLSQKGGKFQKLSNVGYKDINSASLTYAMKYLHFSEPGLLQWAEIDSRSASKMIMN